MQNQTPKNVIIVKENIFSSNKETDGIPTPRLLSSTVSNVYNTVRKCICVMWYMCHYNIIRPLKNQFGAWSWHGAYLAPGHLQQSRWRRPVGMSQEFPNPMFPTTIISAEPLTTILQALEGQDHNFLQEKAIFKPWNHFASFDGSGSIFDLYQAMKTMNDELKEI